MTRAERQRAKALASSAQQPQNPHPFLLAPPPAFPSDVEVPPHRGAVIGDGRAESVSDYPILPAAKARPGARKGSPAKPGTQPSTATTAAGQALPNQTGAAAAGQATTSAPAPDRPAAAEPIADVAKADRPEADQPPPPSALPPSRESAHAEALAAPALPVEAATPEEPGPEEPGSPGQRALVKQDNGLIGRLVAWLGRLVPRKRRTTLPKARTRLERPAPAGSAAARPATAPRPAAPGPSAPAPARAADPAPPAPAPAIAEPVAPPAAAGPLALPLAPAAEPLALPTESILSGRMVLKLSEENSRLRRELEALRARQDDDKGKDKDRTR